MKNKIRFGLAIGSFLALLIGGIQEAKAASVSLHPSAGTFSVGSTFDVSLFLNTEGEYINALEIFLQFSPDKFQLVSPTTGSSIIEIWTSQPNYNNETGMIELRGGIPRGINVSEGLITTLKFRGKSTGSAVVKFSDRSRVFLNDGKGTDVLSLAQGGVYTVALPPPAGPIVASQTHADQSKWYPAPTLTLTWAGESDADGYSYVLNSVPLEVPDDTSEGRRNSVAYRNLADGSYFFHIKALKAGVWGGVTHFAVQVDAAPPAQFPIEIIPAAKTTQQQPIIKFLTTDASSGIDHYELKIVSLNQPASDEERAGSSTQLFIEVESPYAVPRLVRGSYDVIIRAYDNAGNFLDVVKRLGIVAPMFQFVSEKGLVIREVIVIPWIVLWGVLLICIALLLFVGWRLRRWHLAFDARREKRELPFPMQEKLDELRKYQAKYGKILVLLLFLGGLLFSAGSALSQVLELSPPLITAVSKNISNDEIFYVGGKTEASDIQIILYLQNIRTGETISQTVTSDKQGNWFYRHNAFLSSGEYLLWAQSKLGEQISPPSPQVRLSIQATAIQFGASRISYETLYLAVSILLFFLLVGVGSYTLAHARSAREKHREFLKEMREAEESIRRGFAVLRRDIEAELNVIRQAKLGKELSMQEHMREEQLLKDLDWAERSIGKEVWEVRGTEHH